MRPQYLIVAVVAFAAYVLGAKAGESRYNEIKKAATRYWNDPQVKKARAKAKKARDKARKATSKHINSLSR
ncbi:hypothetical protein QMG83_12125 [Salinibacterium sp. G-O1]|uniref:hypothetical protein n=1 Tax=Salinibacterium sp. G-O1 TaxID=3046208 RepID=UPI0024BA6815|nr:hypothetical protein [Salinibacterium sp. G-O1]MDJ0335973.1 hypothetical protein [Salinibacterium sp. G-O1]